MRLNYELNGNSSIMKFKNGDKRHFLHSLLTNEEFFAGLYESSIYASLKWNFFIKETEN